MMNEKEINELKIQLVSELTKPFLVEFPDALRNQYKIENSQLEKKLNSYLENFTNINDGDIEDIKSMFKSPQSSDINAAIRACYFVLARSKGLNAQLRNNKSKNHPFPIIHTGNFIIGLAIDRTDNWAKTNYMNELAEYNSYLNNEYDLFDTVAEKIKEKLFVYFKVNIRNSYLHVELHIPHSNDVKKSLYKFAIDDSILAFDTSTSTNTSTRNTKAIPKLKKAIKKENTN